MGRADSMMTPAVKRLVLNEDVWKIIEEEEERPIESSIFPRGEKGDDIVVVPSFDGNKTWRESLDWLYRYSQWANQEGLSDDKALLYALMHMKHKAGRWGQQFPRSGTWPDFLKGFFERYIPTVGQFTSLSFSRFSLWSSSIVEIVVSSGLPFERPCRLIRNSFVQCAQRIQEMD